MTNVSLNVCERSSQIQVIDSVVNTSSKLRLLTDVSVPCAEILTINETSTYQNHIDIPYIMTK